MTAPSFLIIDDSEPIRFGLTEYFRTRGYGVDGASELEEALALLATRHYDLVITDLRLTDAGQVEGLDIIAEIADQHPGTRVILLTAYGSPAVEAAANNLGVDLMLQKPIRLGDLEHQATALLRRAA